jgi:uncharacterized protein YdeI (YjbR/CyaY-like superfamily)
LGYCRLENLAGAIAVADGILEFEDRKAWTAWLRKYHASSPGVWVRLSKKDSDVASVTKAEALETAICYGWIDGQNKSAGPMAWLQKFTPRSSKSIWSQVNRKKALELIESGKMKPAGLAEVERAKKDGRWEAAYEPQSRATVPADLQAALERNARARTFFEGLDSKNRYAILFRIHNAKKAETRSRRIEKFVAMLEQNLKIH